MEEWFTEISCTISGIPSNIWQAVIKWKYLTFCGLILDVIGFLGILNLGAPGGPKSKYWGYANKLGIFIDTQARKISKSCPDHLRITGAAMVVIGFVMQALGAWMN